MYILFSPLKILMLPLDLVPGAAPPLPPLHATEDHMQNLLVGMDPEWMGKRR
jgi:hypothetical protein